MEKQGLLQAGHGCFDGSSLRKEEEEFFLGLKAQGLEVAMQFGRRRPRASQLFRGVGQEKESHRLES